MSVELHLGRYKFTPRLIPTLLAVVLIPVLISLGLWQLDRAEEKRIIDNGVNEAIKKPALKFNEAEFSNLESNIYRSATITGQYDTKQQFLLDNRTYNGLPGYHVFSPFLFENKSSNNVKNYAVLINRGWIGYQGTREQIVDISLDKEIVEIAGSIKKLPRSIVLKEQSNDEMSNSLLFQNKNKQLKGVSLIQSIQLNRLQKTLNYELLPIMIELDKSSNDGFIREWQPYFGSIDKHNAYALQWFAMATILLFLFFKLNIRKR